MREIRIHLCSAGAASIRSQQLAVARLELGALPQLAPRLADPRRQGVADSLQVAEAEGPRLAGDSGDAGVDLHAREGVGDQRAELRFEAADLAAQLRPGEPLVAIDAKRGASLSFEQIRHSPTRV